MEARRWLELRSGASQYSGTILQEYRRAYEVFDTYDQPPRVILAIGGASKRQYLQHHSTSTARCKTADNIAIRPFTSSAVLIDCELHNATRLKPILAGPELGSHLQHFLDVPLPKNRHNISRLAQDLYWQILFPCATLILIFLDDLGGAAQVLELLATWMRKSVGSGPTSPPRVLIVYGWRSHVDPQCFDKQLRARLGAFLGASNDPFAYATVFESMQLFSETTSQSKLLLHIEEAFGKRDKAGMAFSSEHIQHLLQIAVAQSGRGHGQQLDLQHAVRLHNPPSPEFADHISRFIMLSQKVALDYNPIIASALELDAHPPGMHPFEPSSTFMKHYAAMLSDVESTVSVRGLTRYIREEFIRLSLERREGSAARAHLRLLQQHHHLLWNCHSDISCLVCLARPTLAGKALSCGHSLCKACVAICGSRVVDEPWTFRMSACPLCSQQNDDLIRLRPPTAGVRVLEIGGSAKDKMLLWQFLKDLQRALALPLSLREYFDEAVGYEIGSYFLQTIFLEGWTLSDCKYHFGKLQDPKIGRDRKVVSFGKGLEWKLGDQKSQYLPVTFHVKSLKVANLGTSGLERSRQDNRRDVTVRQLGEGYSIRDLQPVVNKLTASLFYIELVSNSLFYSAPVTVRVRLRCRISPGPPLMSLLQGLREKQSRIIYRGDDTEQKIDALVSSATFQNCRKGASFSKILEMKANSLSTKLNVRMEPKQNCEENISNCPYELKKIMRDQGWDCPFGREDHSVREPEGGDTREAAIGDINELQATLDGVISLYSQF